MKLYQYAVILNPTEKEKKDGKEGELLLEVTTVLAKDDATAQIKAARAIPEEHMDKLSRLEVAVRPF